ncbi:MAG: PAS domain S-box protein [Deltaproteobacteria bacterium]|nr:PAS domain S-box protein [Deltaproteobacteria bacterium]
MSDDSCAIELLRSAIRLMGQGALYDARELLRRIPCEGLLSDLGHDLSGLAERLTTELASKESALATVQTAMWDLEAAKDEIRSSELRYRTTLASVGDGLISTDGRGRVEFMNPAAENLVGWRIDEALGHDVREVFRVFDVRNGPQLIEPVADALEKGLSVGISNHKLLVSRMGEERQIAESCAPIFDAEHHIVGAVLVFRDVTDEHRRREQLRESEERYRALFDGTGEGILISDLESKAFVHGNAQWCAMFGHRPEAIIHLGPSDIHPRDACVDLGSNGDHVTVAELPCRRADGTVFFADVRTTVVKIKGRPCSVSFYADASERREQERKLARERSLREQAEIELRHSQKLRAVGQLAAGVAHEINTPAQFIGDSLYFLSDSFKDEQSLIGRYREVLSSLVGVPGYGQAAQALQELEESVDQAYIEQNAPAAFEMALDGITRISTIVKAMKEFAHRDEREKSPADLNRAILTTLTIARNEYKYTAEVETDLGDLPLVPCHLGDINQVFLNLLVNAAHAIVDVVGKTDARGLIRVRSRREGDWVRFEISDTGCGIPESIRERIFEPFFTTKEVGRGSGQGLTAARSIVVDKHGGSLTFETEVGKGTTFAIRLPIAAQQSDTNSTQRNLGEAP